MKSEKMKKAIVNFFKNYDAKLNPNGISALRVKLIDFTHGGQSIPTQELIANMQKSGTSPRDAAKLLIEMLDSEMDTPIDERSRQKKINEFTDLFTDAQRAYASFKAKPPKTFDEIPKKEEPIVE